MSFNVKLDGVTILVVDDQPQNLNILFEYLRASGPRLIMAPDGERALTILENQCPDIILLDILMPGLDGYETCQRIKNNPKTQHIPVIFMSALSDTVDKLRGFELGAVDFITKPFQSAEVLARIQAQVTILQQHRQLEEATYTRDRFFTILSHDLTGQVANLKLVNGMINEHFLPNSQQQREALEMLDHVVNKTDALLSSLLQWAGVNFDKIEVNLVAISLRDTVEIVRDMLQARADHKGVSIINEVTEEHQALADSNMLQTIFRNLISNAIKFTPAGGEVRIRTRCANASSQRTKPRLEVEVADTGVGISDRGLARIFKIDKKFHTAGTAGETGSGLGLIITRELVHKQGGEIWVESERGVGTSFIFDLPGLS